MWALIIRPGLQTDGRPWGEAAQMGQPAAVQAPTDLLFGLLTHLAFLSIQAFSTAFGQPLLEVQGS